VTGVQTCALPIWFLLGLPTIYVAYLNRYGIEDILFGYLPAMLRGSPNELWWVLDPFYFPTTLCFFWLGAFSFLGGLGGAHDWRLGSAVILIAMMIFFICLSYWESSPSLMDVVSILPYYILLALPGTFLPYLFGFSLRRLAWIFWASRRNAA